jgi:hypothetical protein
VNAARIAAVIGAAVISVTAATAGAAFASSLARPGAPAAQVRSAAPSGAGARTGSCQRMMHEYPAMARMHEEMMHGTRGMGQMNQQMTGGEVAGMMGGDSAAMTALAGR